MQINIHDSGRRRQRPRKPVTSSTVSIARRIGTRDDGGSGLGLAIAKSIVEMHMERSGLKM